MALADYFHRSAVAAAQAIRGWDEAAIAERLEGVVAGVQWDGDAVASREGAALLDMCVRLLARLYPKLHLAGPPESRDAYSRLALEINPLLEFADRPTHVVAVGPVSPSSEAVIYAGSDGWVALLSSTHPQPVGRGDVITGAGVSAALATANLFRLVFLDEPEVDDDVRFSTYDGTSGIEAANPSTGEVALGDATVLVGLGAIGQAAAWALGCSVVTGKLHLVDPEDVEIGNLQRYMLTRRTDERATKVSLAASVFPEAVKVHQHRCSWGEFVGQLGFSWDRVAVALDSRRDRRAVQAALPRWIVNAWTQPGDLGVSVHPWGRGACLACLYQPTAPSPSEDRLIADALGLPTEFDFQIRQLLHLGSPPPPEMLDEVARRRGIDRALLEPFATLPLRTLYTEGICGGAVLPLGTLTDTPNELHVPLAHQSAMAGVLLAAQLMRAALGDEPDAAMVTRLDLLRSVPPEPTQPAGKTPTGFCICQDRVYQRVYEEKYESGGARAARSRRQVQLPN